MRSSLEQLKGAVEAKEAKTQQVGSKATLAHLKTGPTRGVDITGNPPEVYLDALLQGAADGFTATVRTRDDTLFKRLLEHGAEVRVGPPPNDDFWALSAEQDKSIIEVRYREKGSEKRTWQPNDGEGGIHTLRLRDFAPYDGKSVASSLEALPPKKRAALERKLKQTPEAFVRQVTLLMTVYSVLPIVGAIASGMGLALLFWQFSRPDPALLWPSLLFGFGVCSLIGARPIDRKLVAILGDVD